MLGVAFSRAPRPAWWMAAGALGVSASAVFLALAGASPGTATFFRCLLAVPLLVPLGWWEHRREGTPSGYQLTCSVVAGAFFAGDALWWTQAIGEIGAGLSTVLVNAQVVLVPLLALLVDREPVSRRFLLVLPLMVVGIVLTGGVLEDGAAGADPVAGTAHALLAAVCYSAFLFLLRRSGGDGQVAQSYTVVVASAAVVALAVGAFWGSMTVLPTPGVLGWLALVALVGQVAGWLLVAVASPKLPSEVGAALLMLTPVGALVLAALVLGEDPTLLQLTGSALVVVSAYMTTAGSSRR